MAPQHTIYTKDMTVDFFGKSFRVRDMHQVIWTGRGLDLMEAKQVADTLQNIVDKVRGINNTGTRSFTHRHVEELADIKAEWLIQENERLKDEIEELKCDIIDYQNNVHWLEGCAISGGD